MIDFLIRSFEKQDFFPITGYLIGIVGVVWGIWTHFSNQKYKKFSYTLQTFNLINDKLKGVRGVNISFNGVNIPNLSVTEITFWNNGTDTIDGKDIAKNNKLTIIVSEGVEILDYKTLYTTNISNGILLSPNSVYAGSSHSKTIEIDFDYLNSQDGQTIQLYHTGTNSSNVSIVGAIRGIEELNRVYNNNEFILESNESEDSKIERFFKKNFVTHISPLILLISSIFPLIFSEREFSIIDGFVILALTIVLYVSISSYIQEKKNALPKWIKKKQYESNRSKIAMFPF